MSGANFQHTIKLLFLWILIFFVGCKSDEFYVISGTLVDPNQSVKIDGAGVEIWTQQIESGIFEANYQKAGEQITGTDGKFIFKLDPKKYSGLKILLSKEGYYSSEIRIGVEVLSKDQAYNTLYEMLPKAWLEIHVVNIEPFNSDDYFEFRLINAYHDCGGCCGDGVSQFAGMTVDQWINCGSDGHEDLLVQWSERKNKVQVFRTDTVFVKAFDTTRIELKY